MPQEEFPNGTFEGRDVAVRVFTRRDLVERFFFECAMMRGVAARVVPAAELVEVRTVYAKMTTPV